MVRATHTCTWANGRQAVSMVDLVITILITGILSAVAAPKFSGALCRYNAETAAQQVAADLNYARQYARQTSDSMTVSFTLDPPGYTLQGVPSLNKSGDDHAVNFLELGYDVSFSTVDFDEEQEFIFNQYGRPLTADGSVSLTSGTVIIQSGNDSLTVGINSDTGKAEVL